MNQTGGERKFLFTEVFWNWSFQRMMNQMIFVLQLLMNLGTSTLNDKAAHVTPRKRARHFLPPSEITQHLKKTLNLNRIRL